MKIKEYKIKELTLKCVELISKTLVELGQVKDEKHIVVLSQSLANDLKRDFKELWIEDIIESFRKGVRETNLYVLNVQTYYTWIRTQRTFIWNFEHDRKHKSSFPKKNLLEYRNNQKLLK